MRDPLRPRQRDPSRGMPVGGQAARGSRRPGQLEILLRAVPTGPTKAPTGTGQRVTDPRVWASMVSGLGQDGVMRSKWVTWVCRDRYGPGRCGRGRPGRVGGPEELDQAVGEKSQRRAALRVGSRSCKATRMQACVHSHSHLGVGRTSSRGPYFIAWAVLHPVDGPRGCTATRRGPYFTPSSSGCLGQSDGGHCGTDIHRLDRQAAGPAPGVSSGEHASCHTSVHTPCLAHTSRSSSRGRAPGAAPCAPCG